MSEVFVVVKKQNIKKYFVKNKISKNEQCDIFSL